MKKRSKQTLSHYRLLSGKMGELLPVSCVPVIPGDTFQHHASVLVRAAPLNTPVMHPVNVRIHHFYVPNRILWDGWEDFITGGPDGMDTSSPPQLAKPADSDTGRNEVSAYMGVGATSASGNTINALPIRAYNLIFNEYYRDQDLVAERGLNNLTVANIAWEKDYFTTARPWTQKGPEIVVPIGGKAAVMGSGTNSPQLVNTSSQENYGSMRIRNELSDNRGLDTDTLVQENAQVMFRPDFPAGLYADLNSVEGGLNINEFRRAFAIQRYQEARARYGSRFTEYLQYLGIRPSDARLQRPEFLGGGSSRLNFSEVLQTSPDGASEGEVGVGDLYGHGIAGVRTNKYRRFFEEHGYVITLLSVRPKAIYNRATHREWFKKDKEDYYQQELVNLGQQAIWNEELWPDQGTERDAWGYQDRYDEYRYHPSSVSNDFLNTLNTWHLGRDLAQDTPLNEQFITCEPSDRIFQVTEGHNLWIMANQHIVARRLLPKRSRPRIF